jgi:hypothetical protein
VFTQTSFVSNYNSLGLVSEQNFKVTLINEKLLKKMLSQWFSLGPPVSSTNKTDCHDKTETPSKQTNKNIICYFSCPLVSTNFFL